VESHRSDFGIQKVLEPERLVIHVYHHFPDGPVQVELVESPPSPITELTLTPGKPEPIPRS
jgi:hypothetical protein